MLSFKKLIKWLCESVPQLILRLIIAWYAWDDGLFRYNTKLELLPEQQVMPFNLMTPEISQNLLIWWPLVGAVFLFFGFQVRLVTLGLIIIAISSLMLGMSVESGVVDFWEIDLIYILNFQVAVLSILIAVSLLFLGAGGLSIDAITNRLSQNEVTRDLRKRQNLENNLVAQSQLDKAKYNDVVVVTPNNDYFKQQKKHQKSLKKALKLQAKQDKLASKQVKKQAKIDKKLVPATNPNYKNSLSEIIRTNRSTNKTRITRIKIKPNISDIPDVETETNAQ